MSCKALEIYVKKCPVIEIEMSFSGADKRRTQTKSVTPAQHEQTVVPDEGYLLSEVTVGAIPNNYGLITYNGYSIKVS